MFSHTIKKQEQNKILLQKIIEKKIRLIDYECLTENNKRIIAFGKYAGIAGAYNSLIAYGIKYKLYELNRLSHYKDTKEQIEKINKEHQEAVEDTNSKIKILVNEINQKSIQEAEIKLEECQKNINKKIEEEKIKLEKEVELFNKNIEMISSEAVEKIIEKMYYVKPDTNNMKSIIHKYSESYNND